MQAGYFLLFTIQPGDETTYLEYNGEMTPLSELKELHNLFAEKHNELFDNDQPVPEEIDRWVISSFTAIHQYSESVGEYQTLL